MSNSSCIYCNSPIFDSVCVFSPSNRHVSENLNINNSNLSEKLILLNYFLEKIVDKSEISIYNSPLDRFYKRLSGIISHSSEPLLEAISLQETPIYENINKTKIIKIFHLKEKIIQFLNNLNNTLEETKLELSTSDIEEVLLDAILTYKNKK